MNDSSPPSSRKADARAGVLRVAMILARLRTMPVSPISRSTSASVIAATRSTSKPWNTSRNRSRLFRIVDQDRPAWKPSRHIRSNSPRSPRTGTPHSVSW